MAVSEAQFWTTVGFTVLLVIAAVFSFGAYRALRRMDDVLLRARMYVNRKRLFAGFLSLALAMITILGIALLQIGYIVVADENPPGAVSTVAVALSFAFMTWGFYNFWALTQVPKSESERT